MTPLDLIDSSINAAAARITSAKPSSDLRANVMSRIAIDRSSRFAWRYVFAGGAIASVAVVAFVSWPASPAVSQSTISNPTLVNPTIINSRVDPTASTSPTSPVTSVVTKHAALEHAAVFSLGEADLEWSANAPPALERPAPLERVQSLEMKPIDNITPLAVAPLVVPALGDDGSNR